MTTPLTPGTVYIQDYDQKRSKLYTLNIINGTTQLIGEIAAEVYDLVIVDQRLYGLKKRSRKGFGSRHTMNLIRIDLSTGRSTVVGNTGFRLAGLAYNPVEKKLYASAADKIIAVDIKTGKGKVAVSLDDRDRVCGEIAFSSQGKPFITLTGTDKKKYLATYSPATGKTSLIGNTDFPGLASMKFMGDILYGAAGSYPGLGGTDGQIVRINTETGKAVLFNNTIPPARWAGMAIVPIAASAVSTAAVSTSQPADPQQTEPTQTEPTQTDDTQLVEALNSSYSSSVTESNSPASSDSISSGSTSSNSSASDSSSSASRTSTPTATSTSSTSTSSTSTSSTETAMTLLTIDTKENCYVIDSEGMKYLQESVASVQTLSKGSYSIRIKSGQYQHSESESDAEPIVILWLYGIDNSSFINQSTGYEAGTTWTALSGYKDTFKIEAKETVCLHALFFGFEGTGNAGTVELSVESETTAPQTLTVDASQNTFRLNPGTLSSLTQSKANSLELTPGNYKFQIRESTASYWTDDQKFELEPWAILLIRGGKFINNLTNAEVSESWCSLNGLQDDFILEVKETTTVSGYFFDTYKEDNTGQITLTVDTITEAEVSTSYSTLDSKESTETSYSSSTTDQTTTDQTTTDQTATNQATNSQTTSSSSESTTTTSSQQSTEQSTGGFNKEFAFSFQFDSAQMEEVWQQVSSQAEASLSTDTTQEETSYQWEQIENLIRRSSQTQVKNLTSKVARMEFLMKTLMQQIELSFNQTFEAWSGYFDQRLIELLDTKIITIIEDKIDARLAAQRAEERTEITKTIQSELDRRISSTLETRVVNLRNDVSGLVTKEMTQNISDAVKRLEEQLSLKIAAQSNDINVSVTQIFQNEMDKRINNTLENKLTGLRSEIVAAVTKDMTTNFSDTVQRLEEQLNLKVADQSEEIKTLVTQDFQEELDKRIDINFENKVVNLRSDVSSIVNREMASSISAAVKMDVLADIKKQQLAFDVSAFRGEIGKFHAQLAQFETKINSRIAKGDTDLYNWTLEQLVTLQGCITDRQTLTGLLDSFSAELKNRLDSTPCVQPTQFNAWVRKEDPQLQPLQPKQLSGE